MIFVIPKAEIGFTPAGSWPIAHSAQWISGALTGYGRPSSAARPRVGEAAAGRKDARLPGFRQPRLLLALPAATLAVTVPAPLSASGDAGLGHAAGPAAHAAPHALAARTRARDTKKPSRKAAKRLSARRRALLAQLRKDPTLTLNSSFIRRAQALNASVPFTLRLRRPYEGGQGDDELQLTWDAGAVAWPLTGTMPPSSPSQSWLDGAASYQWDYRADTTGYSTLGTVETTIGGGISMTASPFAIAAPDPTTPCTTASAIDAAGISLTSAGARFGTANPYSGDVSGTINLRTSILTRVTGCDGTTTGTAVANTTSADPPLPVAFDGHISVTPGITPDGRMRFGTLTIDNAAIPQRSTFGLVHACTDPTAADGCARKAFPVRTRLLSLRAEVLLGDAMPPPPPNPPVAPAP